MFLCFFLQGDDKQNLMHALYREKKSQIKTLRCFYRMGSLSFPVFSFLGYSSFGSRAMNTKSLI